MVHLRQKGNRAVRKCRDILESEGWITDTCEKTNRFAKDRDLFGVADLVAIKPKEVLFVQVTSNHPHSSTKYREFSQAFCSESIRMEQWVVLDRVKEVRRILYPLM